MKRCRISASTDPIPSTIRTLPRWSAAQRGPPRKPTQGSSSTARAIGSAIAANKIDGIRAVMTSSGTGVRAIRHGTQRREIRAGARRDTGHAGRGARDRDHVDHDMAMKEPR